MRSRMASDEHEVDIRPAEPRDLSKLGKLGAMMVRAHHGFDRMRFMKPGEDVEAGYAWFLGTELDNPEVFVAVAERGREMVGYSLRRHRAPIVERAPRAGRLHPQSGRGRKRARSRHRHAFGGGRVGVARAERHAARDVVDGRKKRPGTAPLRAARFSSNDDRDDAGTPRLNLLVRYSKNIGSVPPMNAACTCACVRAMS